MTTEELMTLEERHKMLDEMPMKSDEELIKIVREFQASKAAYDFSKESEVIEWMNSIFYDGLDEDTKKLIRSIVDDN